MSFAVTFSAYLRLQSVKLHLDDVTLFIFVSGGDKGRGTLDLLLSTTYSRSQMYLSRQLAQLHPELTMPMFSGKFTFRN